MKNLAIMEWSLIRSGWTSYGIYRWRLEKGKLRLIGKSSDSFNRLGQEGEGSDFNLVTGDLITFKNILLIDESKVADEVPEPVKKETKKKIKPEFIYLKDNSECNDETIYIPKTPKCIFGGLQSGSTMLAKAKKY